MDNHQKIREELSCYIQRMVGDSTLRVKTLKWGNHSSQVHLSIFRQVNESTFTGDAIIFIEIETNRGGLVSVYSPSIIQCIKRSLTKESIINSLR